VPEAAPGEVVVIHLENLKAPEEPGRCEVSSLFHRTALTVLADMSFWRFSHDGQKFGDRLWVEIVVEGLTQPGDYAESLAASSVRLPQPPSEAAPSHHSKPPSMAGAEDVQTEDQTEDDEEDEFVVLSDDEADEVRSRA
jgi:hypothetical protein